MAKLFVGISARLDLIMLVPLAGLVEAGVYGAASRIALVYPLFVSSLNQVLSPKFAKYKTIHQALPFWRKSILAFGLLLISLFGFYMSADLIISWLFGSKYLDAIPVFKGLLLAMTGFIIAAPFSILIVYTLKKPLLATVATLVQLLVIFFSNL